MTHQFPPGYSEAANKVMTTVLAWRRAHSGKLPKIKAPDRIALVGEILDIAERTDLVELNGHARELAQHVAESVPNATWMMFYVVWKDIYATRRN